VGENYFAVNDEGNLSVRPILGDPIAIDIYKVVQDLKSQRIEFPLLIRFQDLLRSRVTELNNAFKKAIEESGYQNAYVSVYPIKVNQLHEVVQESSKRTALWFRPRMWFKAELVAALPHLEDDRTLLICNGYKDPAMIRLLLIGNSSGKNVIPILEKICRKSAVDGDAKQLGYPVQFWNFASRVSATGPGKWAARAGVTASKFRHSRSRNSSRLLGRGFSACRMIYPDSSSAIFHLGSQILDIQ
jgi:arginine decarboxylase